MPSDVVLVGIQEVERHAANIAHLLGGLVDRLRAAELKEGIQCAVIAQCFLVGSGAFQRDAVTEFEALRLQHVLVLAQRGVEQRAVLGVVEGHALRALAFDKEGFAPFAGRQPALAAFVVQTAGAVFQLLKEQVLVIAHDHGHAPRQLAVKAGDNRRNTGQAHPSRLVLRGADVHVVPQRRHADRQVRVVSQHGFAATAVARRYRPVV